MIRYRMDQTKEKTLDQLAGKVEDLFAEVHKVIVGQDEVLESLCAALFAQGHTILIGVPGLAKTLIVKVLAQVLGLDFSRIQFTPDLMPADIVGYELVQEDKETGKRFFAFVRGPVFAHLVLADEINRTPPKTQAALLQAMQERQVTLGEKTYQLTLPFQVIATQNPIEQEGTYPLPEALLDRFMLSVEISYPAEEEENKIALLAGREAERSVEPILSIEEVRSIQELTPYLPVDQKLLQQLTTFCRATRPKLKQAHPLAKKYIRFGAGPRALQHWVLAAKGRAIMAGHAFLKEKDCLDFLVPALNHRILLNLEAHAEGYTVKSLLERIAQDIFA